MFKHTQWINITFFCELTKYKPFYVQLTFIRDHSRKSTKSKSISVPTEPNTAKLYPSINQQQNMKQTN